jgi:hypothetical protein
VAQNNKHRVSIKYFVVPKECIFIINTKVIEKMRRTLLVQWDHRHGKDIKDTQGTKTFIPYLSSIQVEQEEAKGIFPIFDFEEEEGSVGLRIKEANHCLLRLSKHVRKPYTELIVMVVEYVPSSTWLYFCETIKDALEAVSAPFYDEHHASFCQCEKDASCAGEVDVNKCPCYHQVRTDLELHNEARFSAGEDPKEVTIRLYHVPVPYSIK